MMKNTVMGPTSREWFDFGAITEMKAENNAIKVTSEVGTVTATLKRDGAEFISYPSNHTGSILSTIQRARVESHRDENGVETQTTTWEVLYDDKHRETFQTKITGKNKYEVLSSPLTWSE